MYDVTRSSVLTEQGRPQMDDGTNHLCDWLTVKCHSRGKPAHTRTRLLADRWLDHVVSKQDRSKQEAFTNPCAPTLFSLMIHLEWHNINKINHKT
ncbi:hypothetical protein AVEN_84962-1 [Araneus ventricosus]|uniref:Uncharacterized protein n=1 Tax=Araneus ventricosus TaxID=182803 RepID=A0A4Y2BYM6_ARAVE|nr:hypothetical protein AVEN_84962-1 [Araneus ventricosus]